MAALINKCEAIFAEVPRLKRQLQSSTHGTDLFDIENGIDYFIANEVGTQITEAVRDFLATTSQNDEHAIKIKKIEQALTKCGISVRKCKKNLDDSIKASAAATKTQLENEVSESWRNFAFGITHISLLMPMKRIEVLEMLGSSGGVSPQDPFPDSISEAAITRRSSTLKPEPKLPTIQHSSGPGSGFSIESFMRRVRGANKQATVKNATPHARARSDFGPRKLVKKGQASAVADPPGHELPEENAVAGPSNERTPYSPPAYSQITSLSFQDKKLLQEVKDDQKSTVSSRAPTLPRGPVQQVNSATRTPSLVNPTLAPGTQQMYPFNPQLPPTASYIHTQNIYVANATWGPPPQWGQPTFQPFLAPGFQPSLYQRFAAPGPYFPPAPVMAPPTHQQPVAYKSSMWSLRQKLATEVFDFLKPDATCLHGIRHFKAHAACPCCMGEGCFG